MAEGAGPLESLGRSWNLSQDYILRSIGYSLLLTITFGLVGALLGALLGAMVGIASVALFPTPDQSLPASFDSTVSSLVAIFIRPIHVIAFVLYYFDLRVREEKYDFEGVQ